jgi:hypothetical protein
MNNVTKEFVRFIDELWAMAFALLGEGKLPMWELMFHIEEKGISLMMAMIPGTSKEEAKRVVSLALPNILDDWKIEVEEREFLKAVGGRVVGVEKSGPHLLDERNILEIVVVVPPEGEKN